MSAGPFARLLAYLVDWLLFAVWAGAATAVALLAGGGDGEHWTTDPWRSQLYGALITTIPFAAYLTLCEGSARGATVGKRLLGLRVVTARGERLPRLRALARTLVKLLPWELGHTAAHQLLTAGLAEREPPGWAMALSIASMALALAWVASLWVGGGRTVHDRCARSQVVRVPAR
ncbi:MAG: RDD family protein [Planctomycetes bacterium]|nr:RDD family protein [Planctomycetota bacterium]